MYLTNLDLTARQFIMAAQSSTLAPLEAPAFQASQVILRWRKSTRCPGAEGRLPSIVKYN